MMRISRVAFALVLVALLALAVTACKKQEVETTPPADREVITEPTPTPEPVEVVEDFPTQEEPFAEPAPSVAELNARGDLKTVYFDFDKADLSDATRSVLRANANWLKDHAEWNVVVYGHCDERGTIEYNLALGQRRANAVREFLGSLSVDTSRLRIVSYGEERPAVQGSNESAWAKNRRAEFMIEE